MLCKYFTIYLSYPALLRIDYKTSFGRYRVLNSIHLKSYVISISCDGPKTSLMIRCFNTLGLRRGEKAFNHRNMRMDNPG